MGLIFRLTGAVLALGLAAQDAHAQDNGAPLVLPTIDVGVTRIGNGGITGASTSVVVPAGSSAARRLKLILSATT